MAPTTIHVKATSGAKITVSVELSLTVAELKATLAAEDKANVPANQQRLIYRGHVMKDERVLESYGLADEHTVHLVKGPAPGGAAPVAAAPAAAAAAAAAAPPAGTNAVPPSTGGANFGGGFGSFGGAGGMGGMFGGMGGMGGMGGDLSQMQQQMAQNPEMMREMLNSPMMRSAMEEMSRNPEMLRQMIASDPRMREVMEANPELGRVLNDPETIRRTLEVARNPELMREQMRLSDRAFANIESHPEGFNAMARMHQDVSEPMMRAAEGRGDQVGLGPSTNAADNPFAAMFAANPVGGVGGTNAAEGGQAANATSAGGVARDPWAPDAAGPGGAANANPFASMFGAGGGPLGGPLGGPPGGGGGFGLPPDQMLSQMEAMLSNPAMGPMMRSMMSDPTVIRQMLDSDPALRAMAEANPGMREMLQNPEVLRRMSDPETLRTNLRMMQQMQSMGMGLPGMGGAPAGGFGGGFGGGAAASATPPEELYASQLAQMKDMGFFDEAQNIRVLQQCMGNVSAAIERLLAGP